MSDANDGSTSAPHRLKLVSTAAPDTGPLYRRLVEAARRGLSDPASLTHRDIQQLCTALLDQYAQMGID